MSRLLISILGTFVVLSISVSGSAQALPGIFVDRGVCPFECCVYRQWTVRSDTALYDQPGGTKRVGKVRKGETVNAIGGEVRVTPTPMTVIFEHGRFHVGDRVYLLTYLGEGSMKVWSNGQISVEEVPFIQSWRPEADNVWPTCTRPSAGCWGRIEKREPFDWWILIKTGQRKRGWTKQYEHFGRMDACG